LIAERALADIEATTISAGGIGGAEGCIVFLLEGKEAEVKKIINVVEGIKGESPVREPV
jgi:hypothetical protein